MNSNDLADRDSVDGQLINGSWRYGELKGAPKEQQSIN